MKDNEMKMKTLSTFSNATINSSLNSNIPTPQFRSETKIEESPKFNVNNKSLSFGSSDRRIIFSSPKFDNIKIQDNFK